MVARGHEVGEHGLDELPGYRRCDDSLRMLGGEQLRMFLELCLEPPAGRIQLLLYALAESAPVGILYVGASERVLYANERWWTMGGRVRTAGISDPHTCGGPSTWRRLGTRPAMDEMGRRYPSG